MGMQEQPVVLEAWHTIERQNEIDDLAQRLMFLSREGAVTLAKDKAEKLVELLERSVMARRGISK